MRHRWPVSCLVFGEPVFERWVGTRMTGVGEAAFGILVRLCEFEVRDVAETPFFLRLLGRVARWTGISRRLELTSSLLWAQKAP